MVGATLSTGATEARPHLTVAINLTPQGVDLGTRRRVKEVPGSHGLFLF